MAEGDRNRHVAFSGPSDERPDAVSGPSEERPEEDDDEDIGASHSSIFDFLNDFPSDFSSEEWSVAKMHTKADEAAEYVGMSWPQYVFFVYLT
eukprot:TRINITY_DN483_c0_g1_i1.p2 TRINITY_DN483_c0_g1~~TRINITY_DN483_c0_g1_i1.p2  ORF type:complete len:93 (-),score=27.17 TRINITY_DN483_c0_g1_i1:10-288(-)